MGRLITGYFALHVPYQDGWVSQVRGLWKRQKWSLKEAKVVFERGTGPEDGDSISTWPLSQTWHHYRATNLAKAIPRYKWPIMRIGNNITPSYMSSHRGSIILAHKLTVGLDNLPDTASSSCSCGGGRHCLHRHSQDTLTLKSTTSPPSFQRPLNWSQ